MKRRRQCAKCPWKVSTDPNEIPHGYSVELHRKLEATIAGGDALCQLTGRLRVFACHEVPPGREVPCVGWLVNQYGPGNNIALRLAVLRGAFSMNVETVGEQHERFEDTLPKGRR